MGGRRKWLMVLIPSTVFLAAGGWWWGRRLPPGDWKPGVTRERILTGWKKERQWSRQEFVGIQDDPGFRRALDQVPIRLRVSIAPEKLDRLRTSLYDQLVCRSMGSVECYRSRCIPRSRNPLDEDHRQNVEARFRAFFRHDPPEAWNSEEIFELFWAREYGPCRFTEAALGAEGALIIVGEVERTLPIPPESFWTQDEVSRWLAWPGGSRRGCVLLHPGHPPLESVIKKHGTCQYAQVVLVVRNEKSEVLSWESYWYLDPADGAWKIHGALINTMRGPYNCPI